MTDNILFSLLFIMIITYGLMLGYIAVEAEEQCGGLNSCIEEAFKDD